MLLYAFHTLFICFHTLLYAFICIQTLLYAFPFQNCSYYVQKSKTSPPPPPTPSYDSAAARLVKKIRVTKLAKCLLKSNNNKNNEFLPMTMPQAAGKNNYLIFQDIKGLKVVVVKWRSPTGRLWVAQATRTTCIMSEGTRGTISI